MAEGSPRRPGLFESLLPVVCLVLFLGANVLLFDGTPHVPLILGTTAACLMGLRLGHSWKSLEGGLVKGVSMAIQACLILMIIGMLIGTWIVSGIVPTMIYYGLKLLSPSIFLVTACAICSLISLATGSSWSTAGTVGVALIGVGQGLGLPLPLVAGAIISGSYLGDKMSPLSDTTNLAPAVAGAELFDHIRHMVYTSAPSFLTSLVLYGVIGAFYQQDALQAGSIESILKALESSFYLSPLLLVPPLLVIAMVIFRLPALPALLGGTAVGAVFAWVFQSIPFARILAAAQTGFVSRTGLDAVDSLLSRGGMESMMPTVALVICALSFGGVMEKTGMLAEIARSVLRLAKSTGSLVLCTLATCITMNIIAPDQYLSIVVPGRMYRDAFRERGLAPKNLSRCLEDAGTLSSALVPWNTGGAYMWATLGVYPFAYLPFAFFNLLNPVISAFLGFTGLTMHRIEEQEEGRSR